VTSFSHDLRAEFGAIGNELADQIELLVASTPLDTSAAENFVFGAMCVHRSLPPPLWEVLPMTLVVEAAVREAIRSAEELRDG
jgi:hypothetical protein